MRSFILRRFIGIIPVVLGVSIITFLLVQLAPGDTTTVLLGPQASEEARQNLRESLGLDQPLPAQYLAWLRRMMTGDFGQSIATQLPVMDLVLPRFGNTLILTAGSFFLAVIIGYVIGILSGILSNSAFDRVSMSTMLLAGSAPPFWLGLMLVFLFAINLRWLPASGMRDMISDGGTLDMLRYLILPAVTTALAPAAIISRIARVSIMEALGSQHVRVARAKGLRRNVLFRRHVILNAMPPLVTITGLQLGYLLGGALLTEVVFAWPGLGYLLYDSITARDLPVIQAVTLVIALSFVLVNIAVDVLNAFLDPRLIDA